ncbi:hypothetical protein GcM1_228056 [Golovinomyces cichoracearum]|uniref:Retrovirus-related Pol polyprotein from transposon TNT 1-94-like beta-barrel domain-containing protein n=1 Tax=Golovinomyces cichoracearum TaxID=62708 RepID=A0A420IP89_9PEZI|nr:hypothetical protein GcM1_228056 [Golovinomyces cichoracearum]
MDVWKFLKDRCNKISESTASNFMSKIQSFPDQFDIEEKEIHSTWKNLKGHRRKLIAADESFRSVYPDRTIFLILAMTLPSTYSAILDSFRGNKWTVEEKLNILIEKKEDSRAHEGAHPAFGKSHYQRQRQNSDVTMRDTSDTFVQMRCYKCHGSKYISRKCPYVKAAIEYTIALREKDQKKPKKIPKRNRITTKGGHGYTAYGKTSDSSSHEFTSNDSSEEPKSDSDSSQPQKVMLKKELISKSTPAAGVLDTGATSSITDQICLFREKFKKIHSTTIQVGGGALKSSHRVTMVVKFADGSSGIAKNVFYEPYLDVNLLSAKRLCRTGMKGQFDEKNVWIKDGNKIMIHAVRTDGLYIVKHIATELRGKPLDTRLKEQMVCFATHRSPENTPQATELDSRLKYHCNTSKKCIDNPYLSDKGPDLSDDD